MKYKVIGWTHFKNEDYPEAEESRAVDLAVIDELREKGYRFGGTDHMWTKGCCPVLNDGTRAAYSPRDWGAIMAEALEMGNSDGMAYYDWFACNWTEKYTTVYPKQGVDWTKMVPNAKIDKSVPPDREEAIYSPYYNCRPTPRLHYGRSKELSDVLERHKDIVNLLIPPDYFYKILTGKKTIDVGIYVEPLNFKEGDKLILHCLSNTAKYVFVRVVAIHRFKSFKELFSSDLFPKTGFGEETVEEAVNCMYEYYTRDQECSRVIGLEIVKVNEDE